MFSHDISCGKYLTFTVTLDDANMDQALFGPPHPFIEISQRYLHLMEETAEWGTVYICGHFHLQQYNGMQSSSTSGESVLLMSSLLTFHDDDVTWEPPGHARWPHLSVLGVGRGSGVATASVDLLRGRLGIVLIGMATVIVVRLVVNLFPVLFLDVVRQWSSVVGLVASMRQGLDWGGGNNQDQFECLEINTVNK